MLSRTDLVAAVSDRAVLSSAATLAAGVIHVAAAVPHFSSGTVLGPGLLAVGWVQIVMAVLLLRRPVSRLTALAAAMVHTGVLVVLVVAWTVGLPFGHGGAETVTRADAITALLQVVAVVLLCGWVARPRQPRFLRVHPAASAVGIATVSLLAVTGSSLAVADLGTGGHEHEAAAEEPTEPGAADVASPRDDHDDHRASGESTHDAAHLHDDGSVHVHMEASAHEHDDGTVHVHPEGTTPPPADDAPHADHGHDH